MEVRQDVQDDREGTAQRRRTVPNVATRRLNVLTEYSNRKEDSDLAALTYAWGKCSVEQRQTVCRHYTDALQRLGQEAQSTHGVNDVKELMASCRNCAKESALQIANADNELFGIESELSPIEFVQQVNVLFDKCRRSDVQDPAYILTAVESLLTLVDQLTDKNDDRMSPACRSTVLSYSPVMDATFFLRLRDWLKDKRTTASRLLRRSWDSVFLWDNDLSVHSLTLYVLRRQSLIALCKSLQSVNALDFEVQALAGGIRATFLQYARLSRAPRLQLQRENDTCSLQIIHRHTVYDSMLQPSSPEELLDAFYGFFDVLSSLLDFHVGDAYHVGSHAGQVIAEQLADALVTFCVRPCVQLEVDHRDILDSQVAKCRQLQTLLTERHFLSKDQSDILQNFHNDYGAHVSQRRCERMTALARTLVSGPLEPVVRVLDEPVSMDALGQAWPAAANPPSKRFDAVELLTDWPQSDALASRVVSSWLPDFVNVIKSALQYAYDAHDAHIAGRYFEQSRRMVTIFMLFQSRAGRDDAQVHPYLAAVCFNNAAYLAEVLLAYSVDSVHSLRLADQGFTYVDLAVKLRRLAGAQLDRLLTKMEVSFKERLKVHREVLSKIAKIPTTDDWQNAVKQCIIDLVNMHNVCKPVLPEHALRLCHGRLVNTLLEQLAFNVLALEDITSDDASNIGDLIHSVMEDVNSLFQSGNSDSSPLAYCDAWPRMQQILFILESSLKAIEERWGDGQGPLAEWLTVEEVRSLVRAVFSNTQQRSTLLAKIR